MSVKTLTFLQRFDRSELAQDVLRGVDVVLERLHLVLRIAGSKVVAHGTRHGKAPCLSTWRGGVCDWRLDLIVPDADAEPDGAFAFEPEDAGDLAEHLGFDCFEPVEQRVDGWP